MLFFAVTIYLHIGTVEGKCYVCICIQCIQNLTNPGLYSHVSIGEIYFPNSKWNCFIFLFKKKEHEQNFKVLFIFIYKEYFNYTLKGVLKDKRSMANS